MNNILTAFVDCIKVFGSTFCWNWCMFKIWNSLFSDLVHFCVLQNCFKSLYLSAN